ncbi:MAG: rRNA maturation RNase YbeY [Clostridia bacterium]|nr:rRNA maturation RNase YbeY [Clostridia bacterium]
MEQLYDIEYLDIQENSTYNTIIEKVLKECFKEEKLLKSNLYVSITLTNPKNIRDINKKFREIDKETDVLSFPMFEADELNKKIQNNDFEFRDILGDMVVSIPKVEEQAKEYGHSFERELAYMIVHSFYHLIGYDHIKEEDKQEMRLKEENILNKLNIKR